MVPGPPSQQTPAARCFRRAWCSCPLLCVTPDRGSAGMVASASQHGPPHGTLAFPGPSEGPSDGRADDRNGRDPSVSTGDGLTPAFAHQRRSHPVNSGSRHQQPPSRSRWGPGGRRFKSCLPDESHRSRTPKIREQSRKTATALGIAEVVFAEFGNVRGDWDPKGTAEWPLRSLRKPEPVPAS
jgi:hypothetical protein